MGGEPADKNVVGSRRAAWRIIARAEQMEEIQGNEQRTAHARDRAAKVELEHQKICDGILSLMDKTFILRASTGESKVVEKDLAATHPIRLGIALNVSVFQSDPDEARRMARMTFDVEVIPLVQQERIEESVQQHTAYMPVPQTQAQTDEVIKVILRERV